VPDPNTAFGEFFYYGLVLFLVGLITAGTPMFFPAWRRHAWEKVAEEFDLYCEESTYVLEGERYGVDVVVRVEEVTQGSKLRRVTQYEVPLGGMGIPPMRLTPENKLLGINLDKLLKQTEVEVGFDKLDDAFLINGDDPEAIAEFIKRSGVGAALLRAVKNASGKFTYSKGCVRITHDGVASARKLRQNIDTVTRCGRALAKAGQSHLAERQTAREERESAKFGV
jgi:hypothetical protein